MSEVRPIDEWKTFFLYIPHTELSQSYYSRERWKKIYVLFIDPDSNEEDYVVVAIYFLYKRLAFIKAGDKSWRHVTSHHVT